MSYRDAKQEPDGTHMLSRKVEGPDEVVKVNANTVHILRKGIRDEVSIDQAEVRIPHGDDQSPHLPGESKRKREAVEGYVMEHRTNHHYNCKGLPEFRVKRPNYVAQTWKPVQNLLHSVIESYCRRKRIPLPINISHARVG